jgi:hypothetical protein
MPDAADVIGVEHQAVGLEGQAAHCADHQIVGDLTVRELPRSLAVAALKLICGGPRRQVPGVAAPTRDAAQGTSGHFVSSTRTLPKYGLPGAPCDVGLTSFGLAGAVTVTSGSAIGCCCANAPPQNRAEAKRSTVPANLRILLFPPGSSRSARFFAIVRLFVAAGQPFHRCRPAFVIAGRAPTTQSRSA